MRITADTNILVRASVLDDQKQAKVATQLLQDSEVVAVPLPALCEYAWVLRQGYKRSSGEVAGYIRILLESAAIRVDLSAVEAGLAMLDAGGDFADGVIAFTGRQMGGSVFASFDRKAIELVAATGGETRLLVV